MRILLFGNKYVCSASERFSVNESAHSYTFWSVQKTDRTMDCRMSDVKLLRSSILSACTRSTRKICMLDIYFDTRYRVIYDEWRSARVRISSYEREIVQFRSKLIWHVVYSGARLSWMSFHRKSEILLHLYIPIKAQLFIIFFFVISRTGLY